MRAVEKTCGKTSCSVMQKELGHIVVVTNIGGFRPTSNLQHGQRS
jgi:hypothetical protein